MREITAFGGINFIYEGITPLGLPAFLYKELGYRGVLVKYTHADIVLALFAKTLVQGTCLADLEIFKAKLVGRHYSPIPSPDTVEYVCQ